MSILSRLSPIFLVGACALTSLPAEAQTIVTFGSGFSFPSDAVVDGSGNIFVADQGHNLVKEILAAGGYTTINTLGGGFSEPLSIAVDGSGNVFVADSGNGAVKMITAASGYATVNTLASGFSFPTGIAVDGSGNVFVADQGNNTVKEILAAGGYTTVNTIGGGFNLPTTVAVDGSGNVFLTNQGDSTVKEILAAGGYTTVNTLGSGFNSPWGVAVDGSGNVFVTDSSNGAIKEIVAAGGYTAVVTLAHNLPNLTGLSVDGNGDVFFAQTSPATIAELKALPIVNAVTPSVGPTSGGNQVTISGAYFTNAQVASFGGALTSISIDSNFQITAIVPSGNPGIVDVTVLAADGTPSATSVADGYTYVATPHVSAITPGSGPVAGSTSVTITGSGLSGVTGVSFGSAAATFAIDSATQITATAPAGSAGTVDVTVTSAGGGTSATSAADQFTYVAPPIISAINPNTGPASGGTLVSIVGKNLTGATGVRFGLMAAASFSVSSPTTATVTAPPRTPGAVNVTITTPGGRSTATAHTLFTYTKTPVETTIAAFAGGKSDGAKPYGWLISDSRGVLYGTTAMGGASNKGTVFSLTRGKGAWTKKILHSFDGSDGATPYDGALMDSAGALYLTTSAGGAENKGAVVKLTPPGYAATVLYSFTGTKTDGGAPFGGLISDGRGGLYGTTTSGGAQGFGTAFRLKPGRTASAPYAFTLLHSFAGPTDGKDAIGTLVSASNGSLYGTGFAGGAQNVGSVFKITPAGAASLLHSFVNSTADGKNPDAGLYIDSKNNLYGTTYNGGAAGKGALFTLTPSSTTDALLFSFGGTNGANPYGALVGDSAGILYGTTVNGGANNKGAVFKLIPPANRQTAWTQSVLYSFQGTTDGAFPRAKLLMGKNNTLYGTASGGGSTACAGGCGSVFMVQY